MLEANYVRPQTPTKEGVTVRSLFSGEAATRPMVTNTTKEEASAALAANVAEFYANGGVKRTITTDETFAKASPQLRELLRK